jgi:hypothetical protein
MKLATVFAKTESSESNIKSRVVKVTSTFAATTLQHFNDSNRPMSAGVAKLYANEMLRGQWKCNGEPIIFSVDTQGQEHLISGQHRLQGLLLANKAVEIEQVWPDAQLEWDAVVVYGVEHSTADTVDTGKGRNHADVLFRDPWIDEVIPESWNETVARRKTWTKTLAGAARLVWLIEGGATVSSAPKFLISEMLDFLRQKHSALCSFITMILDANDADAGNKGLKMSLPYLAALCYVGSLDDDGQVDETTADKFDAFINQLAVGVGYEKGEPAWALAGYWNKLTAEPGSKDRDRDWVGPFVKACNALLEGKTGLKVNDVALSAKEKSNYTDFPIMFPGYMTTCFEHAASVKAAAVEEKELERLAAEQAKAEAKAEKESAKSQPEPDEPEENPEPEAEAPPKRKPAKRSPKAKAVAV